jgi:hypothetical protein
MLAASTLKRAEVSCEVSVLCQFLLLSAFISSDLQADGFTDASAVAIGAMAKHGGFSDLGEADYFWTAFTHGTRDQQANNAITTRSCSR